MNSFDVAMKDHGRLKQVSTFSCVCFTLVTTITKQVPRYTRYCGIFHDKYRGRNFEYRPSLVWRTEHTSPRKLLSAYAPGLSPDEHETVMS